MHKFFQFVYSNKKGFIALSIVAALLMGFMFFGKVLKQGLQKVGLLKTDVEQDQETREAKKQEQVYKEAEKSVQFIFNQQAITKPVAEWLQIADIIHNDLKYSSISDKKSDAVYQLCRVKNDADIHKLIEVFGSREENYFGIIPAGKFTLPQFVVSNLSKSQIGTIHDNYFRKNIKYRF